MKKIPRLLLAVPPWQGLAESLLVCLAILAIVARSESSLAQSVYQTGLFFLCGTGGIWAVLRIRMPHAAILRQFLREAATGAGLSLLLLAVLRPLGSLLNWDALWRLSNWDTGSINFVLGSTGLGYLLARGGVRLWLYWDGLRRRRMLWSLTHAHLIVVVAFAFLSALIVFVISTGTSGAIWPQITDPLGSFVSGLLVTFFPALMAITGLTAAILIILLPLLEAFSFFVARPTTKRLEALAMATAALRAGNYRARVPVLGGDEVAQLQEDFNAMAGKLETTLAELQTERDTTARELETRRNLVAGVSHELRTPVATLQAAVDTVLDGRESFPPEKIRERMGVMQSEIRRLSGLIDDLFTLSQADVDKLPMECAPLSPAALIHRVVEAFAPLAWKA
jgi:signal transduction histidine kinase